MSDVTRLTAAATAKAIADKDISAVEVTQAHLDRIAKVDGQVHAFLHVDAEGALAAAAARVDAPASRGRTARPASRSPSRTSSPGGVSPPLSARRSSRAGGRRTTPPSSRACRPPAS